MGGWMKEGEGISQTSCVCNSHDTDNGDGQRKRGLEAGWRRAKEVGGWGWKETLLGTMDTVQCADDVLLSCTLKIHMVLQTHVIPINSIKT